MMLVVSAWQVIQNFDPMFKMDGYQRVPGAAITKVRSCALSKKSQRVFAGLLHRGLPERWTNLNMILEKKVKHSQSLSFALHLPQVALPRGLLGLSHPTSKGLQHMQLAVKQRLFVCSVSVLFPNRIERKHGH